jgi:hypothetical protein
MSEPGLDDQHLNKCAHAGCHCMVQPSSHFCSDYCAQSSSANISGTLPGERREHGACRCGHPECE